jgi:hypothetical protein
MRRDVDLGHGLFQFTAQHIRKPLNVPEPPAQDGAIVLEAPFTGAPEQLWAFTPVQDTMGGWIRQDIGKQPSIGRTETDPAPE